MLPVFHLPHLCSLACGLDRLARSLRLCSPPTAWRARFCWSNMLMATTATGFRLPSQHPHDDHIYPWSMAIIHKKSGARLWVGSRSYHFHMVDMVEWWPPPNKNTKRNKGVKGVGTPMFRSGGFHVWEPVGPILAPNMPKQNPNVLPCIRKVHLFSQPDLLPIIL